ncbi:MAG: phage tail tape measure C-terminal domain-containing protein [Pseudomonadota bacterium]
MEEPGGRGVVSIDLDAGGLASGFEAASADIETVVRSDILPAVRLIDDALTKTSKTVSGTLTKAAETGKLSFKDMTRSILSDLSKIAVQNFVQKPLEGLLTRALGGFGGARVAGGAVAPGSSFLVGERGPEMFSPNASGRVVPLNGGGRPITINMNFPAGTSADGFRQSQTQIAAMVARAVSRGERNL